MWQAYPKIYIEELSERELNLSGSGYDLVQELVINLRLKYGEVYCQY
jgi:hypothetical protein